MMKLVQYPWQKGDTYPFFSAGYVQAVHVIDANPTFTLEIIHADASTPGNNTTATHDYPSLNAAMIAMGQFIGDCTGDYSLRNRWDPTTNPIDPEVPIQGPTAVPRTRKATK